MKEKTILFSIVILLCAAGFTYAQAEAPVPAQDNELHGSVGIKYLSKYIWRGFDYFPDEHSAFQTGIDLDLYGSGFGVGVLLTRAIHAPFENAETIGLTLSYGNRLYDGQSYVTKYSTGWVYYGYPDESRSGSKTSSHAQAASMQEYFLALSWPEICPAGVVPSYTAIAMWPAEGDSAARKNSGWIHVFGLGYDLKTVGLLPEMPEQTFHLSLDAVYNDGAAPGVVINTASGTVKHDWSHAVFGVSTNFDLGNSLTFTPGVYYQSSWEDTVNTEDEAWITMGLKYAF